jgi:hypothetical protein
LRQRLLTLRAILERWLRLNAWFPHALLSAAVAVAGLLDVVPTVEHLMGATSFPKAILALSAADSDNAFVVLAVKELESRAKTVVAVNDSNNLGRVRRVQPDLIIAPQVLGGRAVGDGPERRESGQPDPARAAAAYV